MSSITQVGFAGVAAPEEIAVVQRGPMRSRGRPSLVDEVAKVTAVFEQQIQELTALVASMREETTALREEVAVRDARLKEAAVASKAAIDAKDAVITTQAAQIADLTARLQAKEDLHEEMREKFQELIRQCPAVDTPVNYMHRMRYVSCQNSRLEQTLEKYFKVEISPLAQVYMPYAPLT